MATKTVKRIQRKRTKNWKMPRNAVYVGRPSQWGNPFSTLKAKSSEPLDSGFMVAVYKMWLNNELVPSIAKLFKGGTKVPAPPEKAAIQAKLQGKHLVCWCSLDNACHADVLLAVANDPSS